MYCIAQYFNQYLQLQLKIPLPETLLLHTQKPKIP